jgi:hypothetical protein
MIIYKVVSIITTREAVAVKGVNMIALPCRFRQTKGVYNYTERGFTKIRAPDHVFKLLMEGQK